MVIAGLQAMTIRCSSRSPTPHRAAQVFNRLMTMHGTAMVFLSGCDPYRFFTTLPLMIGARDLAFPRPQRFRLLAVVLRRLLLYFSYLGGDASTAQAARPTSDGSRMHR